MLPCLPPTPRCALQFSTGRLPPQAPPCALLLHAGCGKTTLLALLAGSSEYLSEAARVDGSVLLDGSPLSGSARHKVRGTVHCRSVVPLGGLCQRERWRGRRLRTLEGAGAGTHEAACLALPLLKTLQGRYWSATNWCIQLGCLRVCNAFVALRTAMIVLPFFGCRWHLCHRTTPC